jgi:4-amino-4-deoxy-L-arabinose transferase-like glycosyltransferase
MIHDYVAEGFPERPVQFGLNYYLHRPKVAFGAWPPTFHVLLAGWMLLFNSSASSVLLFTSFVTAMVLVVFFAFMRTQFSLVESLLLTGALALVPQLQEMSAMVMADALHTLWAISAVFAVSLYIERRRPFFVVLAAAAAALDFLTKNNAVLLAIAIPMTVVLCRAWWILRQKAAWICAGLAAIVVAGWELWAMRWVLGLTATQVPMVDAAKFFAGALAEVTGTPILTLAVVGAGFAVAGGWGKTGGVRPVLAAAISLVLGTWLFHTLLHHETWERYMLPAVPGCLILAAHAIRSFSERLPATRVVFGLAWVAILGTQAYGALHIPVNPNTAYPQVSEFILHHLPPGGDGVVLVSSDRDGEGDLIAEVASREPQPRLWLLRASKVLSHSGWHQEDYHLRFTTEPEVLQYLDSIPVDMVVVDPPGRWGLAHHRQLTDLIASQPEQFELLLHEKPDAKCRGEYCDVAVYRYHAPLKSGSPQIGVGAKQMIGRRLFDDWQIRGEKQ